MNKEEAQTRHALKRAKQRYGKNLSVIDLKQIANKIHAGNSVFVERTTRRITKHLVWYKGTRYLVVFDKTRSRICSFLPYRLKKGDKGGNKTS